MIPKAAVLFSAALSLAATAAENAADFACQARIEAPGEAIWYRAEIPLAVRWQAAHADLRDLRVFGATGETLPFALTPSSRQVLSWSAPMAGEAAPGRENEFLWNFPFSLPLARVAIVMNESNTLAPVIFSGYDGMRPPMAAAPSKKRTRIAEILRGERRLRDLFRSRPRERAREPAKAKGAWRTLASEAVYRLPGHVKDEIDLPGIPIRQLRLQVDPRGSGLGAAAPLIRVALPARDLIFLARGEAPYRLAVGHPTARAADLPLSALIPMGSEEARASGWLGHARIIETSMASAPRFMSPASDEDADLTEDGESHAGKITLLAVLFAAAALLAGMAFSLLRTEKKGDNPGKS
jgi:hypothetical protein